MHLLPIAIGNLSALLVHFLAWWLRQKYLYLIVACGMIGFPAFVGITSNLCIQSERRFQEILSSGICGNGYKELVTAHYERIHLMMNSCWFVLGVLLLLGLVQQRQIHTRYWLAVAGAGGEAAFCAVAVWWLSFFMPQTHNSIYLLYWSFGITWAVLSFLRPFCLHWVRTVLRSMTDTGKPFWEKHT